MKYNKFKKGKKIFFRKLRIACGNFSNVFKFSLFGEKKNDEWAEQIYNIRVYFPQKVAPE